MSRLATVIAFPADRGLARRLVPLSELMTLYGFSERWWRYQIAAGMPTHRFGRRGLRFDPREVEQWMEERNAAP
jgi:predicted DNA-binding transcriptional regulator AlpA